MVLPMYGLDPENDQHISRLVFRIGGERGDGTLIDKFRAVMSRMGIDVQFDTAAFSVEANSDETRSSRTQSPPFQYGSRPEQAESLVGDGPAPEAAGDESIVPRLEALSLLDREGYNLGRPEAGVISRELRPRDLNTRRLLRHPAPVDGQAIRSSEGGNHPFRPNANIRGVSSDTTAHSDGSAGDFEENAERRAELLYERGRQSWDVRTSHLATNLFLEWRGLASTLLHERQTLEELASSTGRAAAIRTARRDWRAATKKHHLDRCERIAARAREIYLVTKSFAQWQDYASDKAERAAIARRHILRLRHFDSWKEAALNEERTVRTFVQGIYLPRWVNRHVALVEAEAAASLIYRKNMAAKCFHDWRLLALEYEAGQWRKRRVKQAIFELWLRESKSAERMEMLASVRHEQNLFATAVSLWKATVDRVQAFNAQSIERQRSTELSHCYGLWLDLSPRLDMLQGRYQLDCLGNVFDTWLMESKVRVLQQRSNRRLLDETFRDWRLIQKMKTVQMQRDRALVGRTFDLLLRHCRETALDGGEANLRSLTITVSRQTMARHFSAWDNAARHTRKQEQAADNDRREVVKIDLLNVWYDTSMRNAEMGRWAGRGRFFLTVDKDFGQWKDWSKAEKERKLREVYAQAKHGVNSRLILSCWRNWRNQSGVTTSVAERADEEWRRNESKIKATNWSLWSGAVRYNQMAERDCERHISKSLFNLWGGIAADIALWDDEAWGVWAERMADSCWKRWNIAFQWVEGQGYNASKAEERRRVKSTHEAFILWRELASADETMAGFGNFGTIGSVSRATNIDNFSRSETSWPAGRQPLTKPRAWTRYNMSEHIADIENRAVRGQAGDGESVSGTSLANTPTRWTGRMGPVMALPSTTPVTALPTPYERELRTRYGAETPSESRWPGTEGP